MAVLLYISCKQFNKALEILIDMNNNSSNNNIELTYNFLNICTKHKLIDNDLQSPNSHDDSSKTSVQHILIQKINENYENFKERNKL